MSDQFWLTEEQVERLRPHFPKVRGKARCDDRMILSGIIHVKRNGLRWRDAPPAYGPHKTLYNRFVRWSRLGVFARIFRDLAQPGRDGDTLMIDIEPVVRHRFEDRWRGHLKAHRTAASLRKGGSGRGRSAAPRAAGTRSRTCSATDEASRSTSSCPPAR